MRVYGNWPRLIAAGVLFGGWSVLLAQTPSRIQEINPNVTATLAGSVNPRVAAQYDIGRMAPSTPIDGITIYFKPTAEQKAELDALVQAQQTPGSPEYHQWLTPAEYADRFGMNASDIQKVESWLESQGFNVERVAKSRTSISFSGTVEQVESAFRTEMHRYRMDGETHFANATNLEIPAALAGVVQSVGNLDDFRPHAMMRPSIARSGAPRPEYTDAGLREYFQTPDDVATIYDINPAYNAGETGSGQTIVVVGQSEIEAADIENFQKAAGLTVKDPTQILVSGSGTATVVAGDESESDLDLEYSGAIAKGATIDFVYVGNNKNYSVFDSLQYAVDNKLGSVISMSYGACEETIDSSQFSTLEGITEQGASQGQSIIASAGDDGSTSCYGDTSAGLSTAQQEALAVNYPASSEYVTGLGGTEFPTADVSYPNTTYWDSSNSSGGGSATQYIPEMAWNDDVTCAAYAAKENEPADALCSGGGGVSVFAARPSWQKGVTGIPSGTMRLVPDVSLDSSNVNAAYLYCTSDTTAWSSGQKASCNDGFLDSATQYPTAAGGTSFAAPIFAGMLAIIDQKTNSTQGVAAAELYTLAASGTTYSTVFHDITSGGNQCTAGSSYCSAAGESEYPTTTGYDEATGLGSVDFNNLMTAWAGGSTTGGLDSTTTTVTPATLTPASGANDVITITVAPTSSTVTATPTGTLTITVDGTVKTSTLALSSGAATYTFSSTTAGAHTIDAAYSGDTTFATSSGSATVTVPGTGGGSASFTLAASNATATQGSTGTSTLTVTPVNSYTGTVAFTATSSDASLVSNGCYAVNNATVASGSTLAIATLTIYTSKSACAGTGVHSFARAGGMTRAAGTNAAPGGKRPPGSRVPVGAAALAGCLLFGFGRMRKTARQKMWAALGCLLLLGMVGLATGCGGTKGTATGSSNDVATGTYTVTVTGTDTTTASLTATATLTLTVN